MLAGDLVARAARMRGRASMHSSALAVTLCSTYTQDRKRFDLLPELQLKTLVYITQSILLSLARHMYTRVHIFQESDEAYLIRMLFSVVLVFWICGAKGTSDSYVRFCCCFFVFVF